jgi:replication-associated recombination protein RarA
MSVSQWRPYRFDEIVGAKNLPNVRYFQQAARDHRPIKALLIGPKGSVKTSLARLLMRSYCCLRPDPLTADPCLQCDHCLRADSHHNGEPRGYCCWEVDCTRNDVKTVLSQSEDSVFDGFLFLDELQRLPELSVQATLLKFVEDFDRGVFLAAAMPTKTAEGSVQLRILPALFDRLPKFRFQPPTAAELSALLSRKADAWQVHPIADALDELVSRAQGGFRECLQVLERAQCTNQGIVDQAFLDEVIPADDDSLAFDPFAEDLSL